MNSQSTNPSNDVDEFNRRWNVYEKKLRDASTAIRTLAVTIVVGYFAVVVGEESVAFESGGSSLGQIVLLSFALFAFLDFLQFSLVALKAKIDFKSSSGSKKKPKGLDTLFGERDSIKLNFFHRITSLLFLWKQFPLASAAGIMFADAWYIL